MRFSARMLGLLLIASTLAIIAWQATRPRGNSLSAQQLNCLDPVAGCTFTSDGHSVSIRFLEAPRTLRPFQLQVTARHVANVKAEFAMAGMDMVPNRYLLTKSADAIWQAQIVLPACLTGRQDWLLRLTLDSTQATIPFVVQK